MRKYDTEGCAKHAMLKALRAIFKGTPFEFRMIATRWFGKPVVAHEQCVCLPQEAVRLSFLCNP